jgi:hypothetical protein
MALTLISTHTASADSSIDITSGIDSTYDSYEWHFVNMHPASDNADLQFQVNADGQSGFNETMTTTSFEAYHSESTGDTSLGYQTSLDQAQGTGYQTIVGRGTGNDNDQASSGVLTLYAPSSTTYVKHFTSVGNAAYLHNYTLAVYIAGYINTTAAIDEISFKFNSGNIDAGTIKMFGVS